MRKAADSIIGLVVLFFAASLVHYAPGIEQQNGPWVAPASAKAIKNPIDGGDRNSIKRGKAIYKERCVICHGEFGKGDGPGSVALDPKPTDHSSKQVQVQSDGELYWKISEGRGAMVSWKLVMSEKERWDVLNYLRTLAE